MAPPRHGSEAIRVGVIGKTGSGKTTVTALVAMACAARHQRVVAVDTDVNPNLGLSLGLAPAAADRARAVPRALARGRGGGGVTVDQLVAGYGMRTPSGVTLLHAMQPSEEAGGCACPAHASARSLLAAAMDERFDLAVVDMEGGLEHLERPEGTLAHADVLLVVMEPSRKSLVTAGRMVARARASGISRVAMVGNKATAADGDGPLLAAAAAEHDVGVAGIVPFSTAVVEADRAGAGLELTDGPLRAAVDEIVDSFPPPGT